MYFDGVKKNFGFGCMRLPMKDKEVDYQELNKMVDTFIENGFNYFDTAHGYVDKMSEIAVRECLTKRYPRESFILTDKLTDFYFKNQEDIRPLFESQLEACGVEYFDFYLMHAQNKNNFLKFKECRAYEIALELKKEGKIKHLGISFHDTADVLDQILSELHANERPELKSFIESIEEFDTIFVGYPNWWGTMPMAVFTFLEHYDFTEKTILPFCTNEGSGMGSSELDLNRLCKGATVKSGLSIHGAEAKDSEAKVVAWLNKSI